MTLVTCRTLYGETKRVPAETLIQRPSVYGIIMHEHHVLLCRTKVTGKYVLPGGGIEKGELIEDALKREVVEEAGIAVEVGQCLHFKTDFFYYDPLDIAIHGFLFFHACIPLEIELPTLAYDSVSEDIALAEWVSIASLSAEQIETHEQTILSLIHNQVT